MIQAFTHDIKRLIEVTPVQNVGGEVILAKVYLDGDYKGIANTVRPEEDSGQVLLELQNDIAGSQDINIIIYGKNRFEETYTQLKQQMVSVPGSSVVSETISFDPQDYDEFNVEFGGNSVDVNSVTVLKRQYETVEGLVIGGQANEKIVVPCDFRRFAPDEDYHIVFVAEGTGVVGRELLHLFAKDGYSFGDNEESNDI